MLRVHSRPGVGRDGVDVLYRWLVPSLLRVANRVSPPSPYPRCQLVELKKFFWAGDAMCERAWYRSSTFWPLSQKSGDVRKLELRLSAISAVTDPERRARTERRLEQPRHCAPPSGRRRWLVLEGCGRDRTSSKRMPAARGGSPKRRGRRWSRSAPAWWRHPEPRKAGRSLRGQPYLRDTDDYLKSYWFLGGIYFVCDSRS